MQVTRTEWRDNPKPLPYGRMAMAIGDVHGCAEHLEAMYQALAEDVRRLRPNETTCVLLGDLVDRGPNSLDCLGLAVDGLSAFTRGAAVEDIILLGNHDAWLKKAAERRLSGEDARVWAYNGGDTTFSSLGIPSLSDPKELSTAVREKLPSEVLDLLDKMLLNHRIGDLLFVHAGVDPRHPLEDQSEHACLWIRDAFLNAKDWPFEVLVIHGHTVDPPLGPPEVFPHRVGIDTGAFATGVLTAVEFLGASMRFVAVDSR
ncbi:MAG: metallophosphoesterase [Alphaproteobacteria bacterium]|nr:metallophosphoesterase [Alphaproteobacteria bacterium]